MSAKPSSRPAHQKNLSMDNFTRPDMNDSYSRTFAPKEIKQNGEHSFYVSDMEPISAYDQPKNAGRHTNNASFDDYGHQGDPLPTILPTIKQNKEGVPSLRGFTKPSTLGNVSGFSKR